MPLILAFGKEGGQKFKVTLSYIPSSRTTRNTQESLSKGGGGVERKKKENSYIAVCVFLV